MRVPVTTLIGLDPPAPRASPRASDDVEIKRFGANPTHVVGDLNCYPMPTPGKFGVFDEYTGLRWPCMREYSSREVNSQASISDTKSVDLNSGIGRSLKPYADIDRR